MKPFTTLALLSALALSAHATPGEPTRPTLTPPPQGPAKPPADFVTPTAPILRPEVTRSASTALEKSRAPFETRAALAPLPDELYFASEEDGSTWVRGRTYKARFGAGGVTFIPFLGSRAPRNFPVELALAGATVNGVDLPLSAATSAERDGERIVIDRGAIDEVYEIGLDSIEQTFVVSERPASGDLRLFVSLQSELARTQDGAGIELANEHGGVRYGNAFVREASGACVPVGSRLVEGGVEIEVAASYLETAEFPLVVDPVVSTFGIDVSSIDHIESDVSYDTSTNRFLIAYQEPFSATDSDIKVRLLSGVDGSTVLNGYVDYTSEHWLGPQCANLNVANQFLCVAQVTNVLGSSGSVIRGRTIEAATLGMGSKFNVSSTAESGDKVLADVGGDPWGGTAYYCVVWQRNYTPTDTDIHARLVNNSGSLVGSGTILIDDSSFTRDSWPSVSKSNGQLGASAAWTIAWHRFVSGSNYDVHMAQLSYGGTILVPSTRLTASVSTEYYPRVSTPLDDGRVLITYAIDHGTDHDLKFFLMSGGTVIDSGNLSMLDADDTLGEDQVEYSIDSDGERFVVVYSESFFGSTFDYDVFASTFGCHGDNLRATESHVALDFSVQQSFHTDVVSKWSSGGTGRRFFVAWDSTSGGQHDIEGAFYDRSVGGAYEAFCAGDGIDATCPCGNNGSPGRGCANSVNASGARLFGVGTAQTGAGDTLFLQVAGATFSAPATLFQGTAATGANPFGDGLRCTFGTIIRIRTKPTNSSGSAVWPSAGEPDISVSGLIPLAGAQRYYQVSYRNAASFCTPATFNVSNGMRVLWLP